MIDFLDILLVNVTQICCSFYSTWADSCGVTVLLSYLAFINVVTSKEVNRVLSRISVSPHGFLSLLASQIDRGDVVTWIQKVVKTSGGSLS